MEMRSIFGNKLFSFSVGFAGSLAWIGEKVSLLGNCVSCFQRMRTEAFEKTGEDHTFCGVIEDSFHISQFFPQKTQNLSGFYNLGLMVSIVIKIQCSLRGFARNIVGLLCVFGYSIF